MGSWAHGYGYLWWDHLKGIRISEHEGICRHTRNRSRSRCINVSLSGAGCGVSSWWRWSSSRSSKWGSSVTPSGVAYRLIRRAAGRHELVHVLVDDLELFSISEVVAPPDTTAVAPVPYTVEPPPPPPTGYLSRVLVVFVEPRDPTYLRSSDRTSSES